MKIFISWSGGTSKAVAEVFRNWLPCVIQNVDPYISSGDIEKGSQWLVSISAELNASNFGIICLTPSNIKAPWVNFEAGALSKVIDRSNVCPFLFGMKPSNVRDSPFTNFQMTINTKEDVFSLVVTINKTMGEDGLKGDVLKSSFENGGLILRKT